MVLGGILLPKFKLRTINLVVLVFDIGATTIFFLPNHIAFHAAAMSLCHGIVLCAMAMLFMLQPCSLCCGHVLCATALCYMQWHCVMCCGNVLCATARTWCIAALHGIILCAVARNLNAMALCSILHHHFFMPCQETTHCCIPWHAVLCCGVVLCVVAKFVMSQSCFFVPWQETMHYSI